MCVCVCVCATLTRVAVGQQGADGQEDLGDGEGRTPVVLQDVQADHPLAVDVAVVDPGPEGHLDTRPQQEHQCVQAVLRYTLSSFTVNTLRHADVCFIPNRHPLRPFCPLDQK